MDTIFQKPLDQMSDAERETSLHRCNIIMAKGIFLMLVSSLSALALVGLLITLIVRWVW